MGRNCGLPSYQGEKSQGIFFKINFGTKLIRECPISYVDWSNVGDAMEAYQYYEGGYLPEVYDTIKGKPLSILDQSEFFTKAHALVTKVKNKAEQKAMEKANTTSPSKNTKGKK